MSDYAKNPKLQEWLIDRRISCYEGGYPFAEACYGGVEEYLEQMVKNQANKQALEQEIKEYVKLFTQDLLERL